MVEINPLPGQIGAEVHGVDLSRPVTEPDADALRQGFIDHSLLLFRDQNLDDSALKHSADWLGGISDITMPADRRGDDDGHVALISNILDPDGQPIGALGDGDMWFHHDNCFTEKPDKATWLYSVELPSSGGNTLFGNCYLAWESLPDALKKKAAGLRVLQVYDYTIRETPDISDLTGVPHHWQPAVVRHPETGRAALYVNRLMTAAIEGMEPDEGDTLLQELFPYMERTDYEHRWRLGDYVIWDNRCSVHARTAFPEQDRRLLKRGKVQGDVMEAYQESV